MGNALGLLFLRLILMQKKKLQGELFCRVNIQNRSNMRLEQGLQQFPKLGLVCGEIFVF